MNQTQLEIKRLNIVHALELLSTIDEFLNDYENGFRGKTETLRSMRDEFAKNGLSGRYDYINKMIDDVNGQFTVEDGWSHK